MAFLERSSIARAWEAGRRVNLTHVFTRSHCIVTYAYLLGLGISGISILETQNIFSGRVPDTCFAEFCTTDDRYDLALWPTAQTKIEQMGIK